MSFITDLFAPMFTQEFFKDYLRWCIIIPFMTTILWRLFAWVKRWKTGARREAALWILGLVFVFLMMLVATAFFAKFKQQLEKTSSLTVRQDNLTNINTTGVRPDLKTETVGIGIVPIPNKASDSLIYLILRIYDSGAPTIVRDWSLKITGADKKDFNPTTIYTMKPGPNIPTPPVAVPMPIGVTGNVMSIDDYLVQKTNHPIESGGMIEGWIAFMLPNVRGEYLKANGTKYEVTFSDVTGKTYIVSVFMQVPPSESENIPSVPTPPLSTHEKSTSQP